MGLKIHQGSCSLHDGSDWQHSCFHVSVAQEEQTPGDHSSGTHSTRIQMYLLILCLFTLLDYKLLQKQSHTSFFTAVCLFQRRHTINICCINTQENWWTYHSFILKLVPWEFPLHQALEWVTGMQLETRLSLSPQWAPIWGKSMYKGKLIQCR